MVFSTGQRFLQCNNVIHLSNNWAQDSFSTEIWRKFRKISPEFQKMKQNQLTVLFFFWVVYGIHKSAASPLGQLPLTATTSNVATGILGNLFKCQYKTKLFQIPLGAGQRKSHITSYQTMCALHLVLQPNTLFLSSYLLEF